MVVRFGGRVEGPPVFAQLWQCLKVEFHLIWWDANVNLGSPSSEVVSLQLHSIITSVLCSLHLLHL